jgi:hypothetical protein
LIKHKNIKFIFRNTKLLWLLSLVGRQQGNRFPLFFLSSFPVLCEDPCQPPASVKKQENGKDHLNLFGQPVKSGTKKQVKPQEEPHQYNGNGKYFPAFCHEDIYFVTIQ